MSGPFSGDGRGINVNEHAPRFGSVEFAEEVQKLWEMIRDNELGHLESPVLRLFELLADIQEAINALDLDQGLSVDLGRLADAGERIADSLEVITGLLTPHDGLWGGDAQRQAAILRGDGHGSNRGTSSKRRVSEGERRLMGGRRGR